MVISHSGVLTKMPLFRPRSILQLTILGFLAVVAPLIAALVIIAQQLDILSEHSYMVIREAAGAMRASYSLIEQTSAMERNARQYSVLEDKELLRVYTDRRGSLSETVHVIDRLEAGNNIEKLISELIEHERNVFNTLKRSPDKISSSSDLTSLVSLAQEISRTINEWTDQRGRKLKQEAQETLKLLHYIALIMIVTALFLGGMFTVLITRPLRQIDSAIHQLGKGGYETRVHVKGPLDLRELGTRLEWLRNRLGELEQQRTRFLRHVSHELKTPLTAIQEGIALLNDGLAGTLNRQQKEIMEILRNNSRRLQHLIENLLRYRSNSHAGSRTAPVPTRLDAVINRVVNDHSLAM